MPRLVRMTLNGPIKIEPREKPVWVCGCGLSQTFPICDGAHKGCPDREKDPSALYVYDAERKRVVEQRVDSGAAPVPMPPAMPAPNP